MHIEPGVVDGAKMILAYATGAGSLLLTARMSAHTVKQDGGFSALLVRSAVATLLVLCFFQVLPHYTRGISEVHFIFGGTLYLIFGAGPAGIGLALGLLLQGALFEPSDLPQYFLNLTTLIVPLYLATRVVRSLVPHNTPYVGMRLWQAFAMSAVYQGGIIVMVALWALYGQGFGEENLQAIATFGVNYLVVIIIEPLVSMLVLALARRLEPQSRGHPFFYDRLHHPVS